MADEYERAILTVDVVCFTLINGTLHTLLVKRDNPKEPFYDFFALPGGWIHTNEDQTIMDAAKRITMQKLGIDVPYMEQLGTFNINDPRGWTASVVYIAIVQPNKVKETTEFFPVDGWNRIMTTLAFNHDSILDAATKRIRDKTTYSSLPLFLMPETFTLAALQDVYESILQQEIDKASFRRKVLELGIIELTGEIFGGRNSGVDHRPAKLYKPTEETLKLFKSTTMN